MQMTLTMIMAVVFFGMWGLAGFFLFRNPRPLYDLFYKQYEMQPSRFTIGFLRGFGIVMMTMVVLGVIMGFVQALSS